jgi:ABC-type branched-subunit amino acid transport system substrate-binding protein
LVRIRAVTERLTVFDGADQIVELLRKLVTRPRFGEAPERNRAKEKWRRGGRKGLPMVCLVRDAPQQELLAELGKRLAQARPRPIPHARHVYVNRTASWPESGERDLKPAHASDIEPIREVLADLATDLAGRDKHLRFPRFRLVRWLTQQSLQDAVADSDVELLRRLRARDLARRRRFENQQDAEADLKDAVPSWARALLLLVPPLWFRARIAGLGAEYRWLLGQPYLAPRDPGTFVGFAERLTADKRDKEDPEQLLRLLVNAFLADLRHQYRRRPWRPGAARRTVYPVVLLDGVTRANGGYRLLNLINDVRNDTGAFDPVLFVSGSEKVPPFAIKSEDGTAVPIAHNALAAYRKWSERFNTASRARTPTAWYLPIKVPPGPTEESDRYDEAREQLLDTPPLATAPPPFWSRRWVLAVAALAVAGGVATLEEDQRIGHCGKFFLAAEASTLIRADNGECIGVTEKGFAFQPSDIALSDVQAKVGELNQKAAQAHRDNPNRPYVSLVFIAALTSPNQSPILASERESLAGIAVVQDRQIAKTGDNDPLLRILVANAGSQMRYGSQLAELLHDMVKADESIVGAVGFDQSRQPALDTIDALSKIGLPMVASTLSADQIPERSPLYYQVSPQNKREAAVAANYAASILNGPRRVLIVSPDDPGDTYSNNLREDAVTTFRAAGFEVEPDGHYTLTPGSVNTRLPGPRQIGQERICAYPGVVFFTGRIEGFEPMLDGINGSCKGAVPKIIGGDDISRYVANRTLRARYPAVPFYYLTFAIGEGGCDEKNELYHHMRLLFPQECQSDRDIALDEYAPLAYDATLVYVKAVERIREERGGIPLNKSSVWHHLGNISGSSVLEGESGTIDFGGRVDQHVPLDKFIAMMRVDGPGSPVKQGSCGRHRSHPPSSWCPPAG